VKPTPEQLARLRDGSAFFKDSGAVDPTVPAFDDFQTQAFEFIAGMVQNTDSHIVDPAAIRNTALTSAAATAHDFDGGAEIAAAIEEMRDEDPFPLLASEWVRKEFRGPPMLRRLLAAGFEQAELCLVATRDLPTPSYRFIGYLGGEAISYTLISDEPGALERVEEAVMGKLRGLMEEREAQRERDRQKAAADALAREERSAAAALLAKERAARPGFTMDGSWHLAGDPHCPECVGGLEKCACGGLVHEQAVYGPSIMRVCDRCGKPDADEPPEPEVRQP
jgi:hypothetical protein